MQLCTLPAKNKGKRPVWLFPGWQDMTDVPSHRRVMTVASKVTCRSFAWTLSSGDSSPLRMTGERMALRAINSRISSDKACSSFLGSRSPKRIPREVPRKTKGSPTAPIASPRSALSPKIRTNWIASGIIPVTSMLNRNALLRRGFQGWAMTQIATAGPPIPQNPSRNPLIGKATHVQKPGSSFTGSTRTRYLMITIKSSTMPMDCRT